MIDDAFVIDAVAHGYDFSPENQRDPFGGQLGLANYYGFHSAFVAPGQPQWVMPEERFMGRPDPYMLAHALFAESSTDVCIYHGIPDFGVFNEGSSPLWVGKEMRERWPGRVALYGPISPWMENALEEVDRLVEEEGVVGLKLYPAELVNGRMRDFRTDDPDIAFPLFERAQEKGIRAIAVHKAIPVGPVPMDPFRVGDVDGAAMSFPDLTFEIVHGGFAFVEETAFQLWRFPNVVVNLEATTAYLANSPRKFAEIIGAFLASGAEDRLTWATGCIALHPQPLLEAFMELEIPEELVQDGIPPLTAEIKHKILGSNAARIAGLDVEQMRREFAGDEFDDRTELAQPWSAVETAA